jgi:hypothetical protein
MTVGDGVTSDFQRLVDALLPYLPDVVVVGGWAHRLFTRHPLAGSLGFVPLMTDDADVAVPLRLRRREVTLLDRLEAAGFTEDMKGDDKPPVTHYRLGEGEFYVEFLAPTTGEGVRRSGERDATARVQGVVAQKLPHVDMLLVEPWTVSLPSAGGEAVQVRIPNAVTYLVQKMLVLPDRERQKQSNDVVYVHDTLMMFADNLSALGQLWGVVKSRLTKQQVRDAGRALAALFGQVDDRIRRAAIIAREIGRGSPPSAELIRARCHDGLQAIFG